MWYTDCNYAKHGGAVMKLGNKAMAIIAVGVIAAAICMGYVIECFEGETFVEETATTAGDVPAYIEYSNHFIDWRININAETAEELMELDGIGEKLAQRIIDYRSEHGVFAQTEGIMLVPGIGEKVYENIKDKIIVE